MKQLKPDEALILLHATLPMLENEHRTTRTVIAAIPADQGEYRPDPISKPAFELAWHLASADNLFLEAVVAGDFKYASRTRPESVQTPADIADWYGKQFAANAEKLAALSGEQLAQMIDFRGRFSLQAVRFVQIGMSHAIHHRGQLSVYLRPMGGVVPTIYGESHADVQARKAAESRGQSG